MRKIATEAAACGSDLPLNLSSTCLVRVDESVSPQRQQHRKERRAFLV